MLLEDFKQLLKNLKKKFTLTAVEIQTDNCRSRETSKELKWPEGEVMGAELRVPLVEIQRNQIWIRFKIYPKFAAGINKERGGETFLI